MIRPAIPDFATVRLLVAGDVMLDRYWHGETRRISPEAPVPVVHLERVDDERPGGAANVAVNLARLGVSTRLLGAVGEDEAGLTLRGLLDDEGVDHRLTRWPGRPTATKTRVLSRHQQLIRLDREAPGPPPPGHAHGEALQALLRETDAVVLSDYAKGYLADAPGWIAAARRAGRPVYVDPKGADFGRYRGASAITPNLAEFEAVVGGCPGLAVLAERGEHLCRTLGLEALLVTRGEQGMSLLRPGEAALHLPARAREVFDVTGAGDTVIAVFAAALAAGETPARGAALANLAAGIVVGKIGTASVARDELDRALHAEEAPARGMVEEAALLRAVAVARGAGERIVMTNGCFDLLHAGHVAGLAAARALGERLVVAVNDDASVTRLKGAGRPLVPLAERMEILAALGCVDWVVAFAEDTPERLVDAVAPDVLAKGGDYRPEEVAGGARVIARGGRVEILPLRPHRSTSALIAAARRSAGEGSS